MSSFKHPVGSQSSRVYWRRRATVIAVLLLVVIVIALFAAHAGSGSGMTPVASTTRSTPAAAAPAATPTVAAPVSGASAAATPGSTPTPADAGSSSSGTACTASDITLQPLVDKSSYTSLEQPEVSMSITNSSSAPCSIDLGSSQQMLTITSGSETYWSSKDCQVNGTHQIVKMTAGQTLKTPAITWDRTRSSTTTCSTTRSSVPAGGASYHLSVAVGSITSTTSALLILN